MADYTMVLNAGSSSLKFCVYEKSAGKPWRLGARGQIGGIGTAPVFTAKDESGGVIAEQILASTVRDGRTALETLANCLYLRSKNFPFGRLMIYANVSIYHDCVIGERVILHSGAVIGADGFGIAMENGRWKKIPQIGRVVIGNDVEVGANTTIDRGALDDTVLEEGVKLDNQIQIGHNCRIGAHTAIAGCVGIAGSTRVGRYCRIGGSAMIGGHLEIVDNVEISGATSVPKSLLKAGTYTSLVPISLHQDWLKNASHIRHLDSLATRVKELEARLADLERKPT